MNSEKNQTDISSPILLFDGVCNLCNYFVQFIIKRDKQGQIKFASLQSEVGQSILGQHQLPTEELQSVVFVEKGKAYTHSSAALQVLNKLGYPWRLLMLFSILPKGFRDWVYDWIAVNRYRWFGKQDSCMMPDENLAKRFLD